MHGLFKRPVRKGYDTVELRRTNRHVKGPHHLIELDGEHLVFFTSTILYTMCFYIPYTPCMEYMPTLGWFGGSM